MNLPATIPAAPPPAPLAVGAERRFTVGNLLSRSFSIWWSNLGKFFVLALVVYVPMMVVAVALGVGNLFFRTPGAQVDPAAISGAMGAFAVVWLVAMALLLVQMAALTYGAIQSLAGQPVQLGDLLRAGLRRAPVVLGVGVICYLASVLGFVLLIVPGLIVLTAVSVSVPVAVVERNGIFGSVRRSFQLTKGRRLAIFAAFLVFFAVFMGVSAFVNLVFPALAALGGQITGIVGMVISTVVSLAIGSLGAIAPAVAYHDLRAEKEGVDTASLVKVFG
ncbi:MULTISPECIES: hypothetical protein [Anaeromyxobacter]|uniref:hypothetical protein n=1 Tax=Anaeromyxobacter TaxID=161492 RepID=UPI001F56639B|nr:MULTISPECIES: hypothetical protein [unclassified Anaeromyxobacter]